MKAKKIITLFITAALLSCTAIVPAYAEIDADKAVFYAVEKSAAPGSVIDVEIKGILSTICFSVIIGYNAEHLTYVSAEAVGANKDGFTVWSESVDGADGRVQVQYINPAGDEFDDVVLFKLTFNAISMQDFKALGVGTLVSGITLVPFVNPESGIPAVMKNSLTSYAVEDIICTGGNVSISLPEEAPTVSNVIIDNPSPVIGDELGVSYTFYDENGDVEDTSAAAVEWIVGGEPRGSMKKSERYLVTKDDYGKEIVARVTPVALTGAREGAPELSPPTRNVAANPNFRAVVTDVSFTPDTFCVGSPVRLSFITDLKNGGNDVSEIEWAYEDGSMVPAGNVSEDKRTYTPSMADFYAGKKIRATIIPKGDRDAEYGEPVSITSDSAVVLGPVPPSVSDVKILKGDLEVSSAMVGETLRVSYEWHDENEEDGDKDTSLIEWKRNGEVVHSGVLANVSNPRPEAREYTLTAADRDAEITVTVTAKSSGNAPNPNTGVMDTGTGEAVTAGPVTVSKNPSLLPEVVRVSWDATAIYINKAATISFDFEDKNGYGNESEIKFEWANVNSKDANWKAINSVYDSDSIITVGKARASIIVKDFYKNKYIRAVITPKNSEGMKGEAVVSSPLEVKSPYSGGGGGTGGGGGGKTPGGVGAVGGPVSTPSPSQTPAPKSDAENKGIERFSDIPHDKYHWAVEGIDALVKAGVIHGMTKTTFEPESKVTRAQFIAMVIRALNLKDDTALSSYDDVKADHWGYTEIASAEKYGIISFFSEAFLPDKAITRDEMAAAVYNAAKAAKIALPETEEPLAFSDADSIGGYARDAVPALQRAGIIHGMDGGAFVPKGEATRAQASKVVYLLFKLK